MKRRGELKLIEQAIRQGWNISDKGRHDALVLIREVLDDSDATARERLRACSVAVAMADANMLADEDAALLDTVMRIGQLLESEARAAR